MASGHQSRPASARSASSAGDLGARVGQPARAARRRRRPGARRGARGPPPARRRSAVTGVGRHPPSVGRAATGAGPSAPGCRLRSSPAAVSSAPIRVGVGLGLPVARASSQPSIGADERGHPTGGRRRRPGIAQRGPGPAVEHVRRASGPSPLGRRRPPRRRGREARRPAGSSSSGRPSASASTRRRLGAVAAGQVAAASARPRRRGRPAAAGAADAVDRRAPRRRERCGCGSAGRRPRCRATSVDGVLGHLAVGGELAAGHGDDAGRSTSARCGGGRGRRSARSAPAARPGARSGPQPGPDAR